MKTQILDSKSEDSKREFLSNFIQKKLDERGAHSFDLPIAISYSELESMGLAYVDYYNGSGGIAILQIESIKEIPHVIYMRF